VKPPPQGTYPVALGNGEFFGERARDDHPSSTTVRVLTYVQVMALDRENSARVQDSTDEPADHGTDLDRLMDSAEVLEYGPAIDDLPNVAASAYGVGVR
jgi:hypothetical protein